MDDNFRVVLTDGRVYAGWRAIPWILLFSPLIASALLFGGLLQGLRWVTGRDYWLGFLYQDGTWRREP